MVNAAERRMHVLLVARRALRPKSARRFLFRPVGFAIRAAPLSGRALGALVRGPINHQSDSTTLLDPHNPHTPVRVKGH